MRFGSAFEHVNKLARLSSGNFVVLLLCWSHVILVISWDLEINEISKLQNLLDLQ